MNAAENQVAVKLARELIAIGEADPPRRAGRLAASAGAVRALAEADEVEAEVARDSLLLAAVRAGIDAREASRIIQQAWPNPAPPASAPADGIDAERTGEHPTALVCAAHGLDRLVEHMRSIDDRRAGPAAPDRWGLAAGSLTMVPGHLLALVRDVARRLPDDHLADGVAIAVMLVVQLAADLGLDLGAALARNAPTGPA